MLLLETFTDLSEPDRPVYTALNAWTATDNAGLKSDKTPSYILRKTIKDAKQRYRDVMESYFNKGSPILV